MKPTLVVLAAGMGSRYGGLKQIDPFGPSGETIMDYSVYDAIRAGFGKVVFIIRKSIENDFRSAILKKYEGKIALDVVFQELDILPEGVALHPDRVKPWGTGHAVWCAASKINEPFAVINADDFYGAEGFAVMADYLSGLEDGDTSSYSMVGYDLRNTLSDFGSVARGVCQVDENNDLISVVERTAIEKTESGAAYKDENGNTAALTGDEAVSMNFWGFTPSVFKYFGDFFQVFAKENADNIKSEFYIPTGVDALIKQGKVSTKVLRSDARWFGVTYQEDKESVVKKIQELVDAGKYPSKLW